MIEDPSDDQGRVRRDISGGKTVLKDKIAKYAQRSDLNCAGFILASAIEEYGIDADPDMLDAAACMGGGMCIEEACGAVTGSMMALGLLFNKDQPYESGNIKRIARDFFEEFNKENDSIACRDLKKTKPEEERCGTTVVPRIGEILDRIVQREMARRR